MKRENKSYLKRVCTFECEEVLYKKVVLCVSTTGVFCFCFFVLVLVFRFGNTLVALLCVSRALLNVFTYVISTLITAVLIVSSLYK